METRGRKWDSPEAGIEVERKGQALPVRQKPGPKFYPALDNDLARENLWEDLPSADRQDRS